MAWGYQAAIFAFKNLPGVLGEARNLSQGRRKLIQSSANLWAPKLHSSFFKVVDFQLFHQKLARYERSLSESGLVHHSSRLPAPPRV